MLAQFIQGYGLGTGLIAAIGAQNAHVLRTGIRRRHIGLTVAICIACDMLLIAAGVAGMGALIADHPNAMLAARWLGAAFLVWYGIRAARAAFGDAALHAGAGRDLSRWQALSTVLALTLLNPHVYLDTVVLLGVVGAQRPLDARPWFAAGAMAASAVWFSLLGYGARMLAPLFARPLAWRVLDGLVACVMFALAAMLLLT
ncbi:MAG TPA: LysE/ArgO family amino acid transporter [Burkholderiaceae bacterium]